ncbi:hypothetical protein FACUT_9056 [Fusarium acutatum]|uniref:Uncharacterized protein n=1 Tax=Fusarium acutatum TaxID=78861 RepID=A0A8H4JIZ0_9HYPO|nr:hypothetical protein FACUT_9056 [Fusarium acutatum]
MTFRFMSYGMLLDEDGATEGVTSPEACCVRLVNLRAWLGGDVVEGEEVALMEDDASYEDSISVDYKLDDGDDGDDERALNLWQAVINGSDVPTHIELDVMVSYIRLHMPTEFKRLSAIIAQQATGRIGPDYDRHGVEIPELIIDAIEQARFHALSNIRNCIDPEIEFCKAYVFKKDPTRIFEVLVSKTPLNGFV